MYFIHAILSKLVVPAGIMISFKCQLASFPGSNAVVEKNERGTHSLHILSSPRNRFLGIYMENKQTLKFTVVFADTTTVNCC